MIGKISTGCSFYGCISYCLEDKKLEKTEEIAFRNRAEVLLFHQCFGNKQELTQQFEEVRALNHRVKVPVLHVALSLSPGEQLEKAKLMDMVEECARSLGFEHNQYLAVKHMDTGHQHVHIVANRIGFDGKVVKDSHNYRKVAAYCRQMERKYRLRQVLSPRRFLSPEQRLLPRLDQRKEAIQKQVESCLAISRSLEEFRQNMQQRGYKVCKGRGLAIVDPKTVKVKGSELGYPLWKVEKILQQQAQKRQLEQGLGMAQHNPHQGLEKKRDIIKDLLQSTRGENISRKMEQQESRQQGQSKGPSLRR
ncbi:relaxase/mobilization nuclease domain-containing protein [Paraflavisolibacter sp. H34]|uniref:relaxase/mobilization nuclease domain-containing protein n=1 Tax=Huijunlia imazamoxiresistens TaxID=3127457 RepID=UPI00301814C7